MTDDLPISTNTSTNSDDFIPVPDVPTTNVSTSDSARKMSLAEKLKMAKLAMQGPERTVKRERNEREKQIEKEKADLEQLLALTTKKKEDLEIAWVVLDNKRNDLKKMLAPILEEEEKLELEEEELEGRERTTTDPLERQKVEKDRLAVQAKRQTVEKEKWGYEDKIFKLETSIKENTDKYQIHLDEEEEILGKIDNLDGELALIAEQERLEEEERRHKAEIALAETEKRRREELQKVEQAEAEKKKAAELAQKVEEAKKKEAEEKAKKEEAAKKAAELARAGAAANLEVERAKAAAAAQKAIDEAKRKAEELATMKARGEMEMKRQEAQRNEVSFGSIPQTLNPQDISTTIPITPEPTTREEVETSDLPKLRTLKTDIARLKQEGK